mgnify:CR=1 FL=1
MPQTGYCFAFGECCTYAIWALKSNFQSLFLKNLKVYYSKFTQYGYHIDNLPMLINKRQDLNYSEEIKCIRYFTSNKYFLKLSTSCLFTVCI